MSNLSPRVEHNGDATSGHSGSNTALKRWVPWAGLPILAIALAAIIWSPVSRWGAGIRAAYEAGDCTAVARMAAEAEQPPLVTFFPAAADAEEMAAQCDAFSHAVALQEAAQWAPASEAFLQLLKQDPESALAESARGRAAECALAMADEACDSGEYAACAAALARVRDDFSGTGSARSADQAAARNYLAWAKSLLEEGSFDEAHALAAASAEFNTAWQAALQEQGREGMATARALPITPAAPLLEEDEVMREVVEHACMWKEPAEDARIGSDPSRLRALPYALAIPGKTQGDYRKLSTDVVAQTPDELRFAVCISLQEEEVGQCQEVGALVSRRRLYWDVRALDLHTGEEVASGRIEGSEPGPCGGRIWFFGNVATINGSLPDPADLEAWLKGVLAEAEP